MIFNFRLLYQVIRFGHDWDPSCMKMDEVLYSIAEKVKNFAVLYLVDITKVPDFNKMYVHLSTRLHNYKCVDCLHHASECSFCCMYVCMRLFTGVDAVAVCPSNWQPVFNKHTSNAFRDWNFSSQILHEKWNIHAVIIKYEVHNVAGCENKLFMTKVHGFLQLHLFCSVLE